MSAWNSQSVIACLSFKYKMLDIFALCCGNFPCNATYVARCCQWQFPARLTRCTLSANHMQLQSIPSAFYATVRQTQIKRPICTPRHFSIELLSPQHKTTQHHTTHNLACNQLLQLHYKLFVLLCAVCVADDNAPVAMLLRLADEPYLQQVAKQICQTFDHLWCRIYVAVIVIVVVVVACCMWHVWSDVISAISASQLVH